MADKTLETPAEEANDSSVMPEEGEVEAEAEAEVEAPAVDGATPAPEPPQGEQIPVNTAGSVKKDGYTLHFVNPLDETTLNALRATGKTFGEISVTHIDPSNDQVDEIVVAIRQ